MKIKLLHIVTASLLLLGGAELHAQVYQAPPVTISKDKVRSNDGKLCYSHFVPEKQTLYSICKAYGVTPEEVYAVNPGLKEKGVQKNTFILIPVKDKLPETPAEPAKEKETAPVETTEAVPAELPVQKKEEELQEEIEQAEEEPVLEGKGKKDGKKDYIIHRVKWYENIDDIALKYQISAEHILKFNGLEGKKIKSRMKLKIPTNYDPISWEQAEALEDLTDTKEKAEENIEEKEESNGYEVDWFNSKKNLNILLNLPFNSSANPNKNAYDFYSGFLLAINDLENDVTNIDLSVYDCTEKIPVTQEKVEESQMIFGPISSTQLETVARMRRGSSMLISPLDPRAEKLSATYSNFIQVPPCNEAHYTDIARWVAEDFVSGDNIITIYEKNNNKKNVVRFNEIIRDSGIGSKFFSYTILEGRTLENRLANELTLSGTNRIIINSENEAFVNDVIRNLNILLHKKHQIIIYCPSKVKSFATIDIENLHNLNTHMAGSYHTDFENPETRKFVMKYRGLYNSEPSQFAFQGYDVATYFIGLYTRYGVKWNKHLEEMSIPLKQITFDFRRTDNGSYLNQGTRRFIYEPDFQIRTIK